MNNPEEINIFKNDLRKVHDKTHRLEKFLLVCDHIHLVYVLSGRGSALKQAVDHAEVADPEDDYERMYMGVLIANEIYRRTKVRVPIYYNGRALHNKHLREALDRGIFDYPKECFIIEEINPNNTIGQALTFGHFLSKYPYFSNIAVVSSAYHLPRVARTFGKDSPTINHDGCDLRLMSDLGGAQPSKQGILYVSLENGVIPYCVLNKNNVVMEGKIESKDLAYGIRIPTSNDWRQFKSIKRSILAVTSKRGHTHDEQRENPIENANLVLFGFDRSFDRPGILNDLRGELEAMDRYSSGANPTIARYQPTNTFLNKTDVLFHYSLYLQKKQKVLNREPALLVGPEQEPEPKRQRKISGSC